MTLRITFEEAMDQTGFLKHLAYNAADCVGTLEIAQKLIPRLHGPAARTYAFERAMQNPAFAMMRRGIKVDEGERARVLKDLGAAVELELVAVAQHPLVVEHWDGKEKETGACPKPARKDGKHKWEKWETGADEAGRKCSACGGSRFKPSAFNANSPPQAQHLFYDLLALPKLKNKKGEVSTDEETLQRLARKHPKVAGLIGWEPDEKAGLDGQGILYIRSLKKQLGEVKAPLSPAGRYLFSMNIGATIFGRSSSSSNPQRLGGNIQNKAERQRSMFIADHGFEMANFDLMRAESMLVAYQAEDEAYIQAHLTDTHTYVARLIWPGLPWTGDIVKDKAVAMANPPWDPAPGHNYRFQAKRIQHGSNYGLTPPGISAIARIPLKVAAEAQEAYFTAFPGIRNVFQAGVKDRVIQQLPLVTPLGHEILLMGRPNDPHTWKQGYAAIPQGTVGHLVWMAIYRIWQDGDPDFVQVLANGYDSALVQWRKEDRAAAIPFVVERFTIPVQMPGGRTMMIPVEGSVGVNWAKYDKDKNPNGLRELEL